MKKQKNSEKYKSVTTSACPLSLYDDEDFLLYLEGDMPDEKAERLFLHVDECEACQIRLAHCHRSLVSELDDRENDDLLAKTMELLDRLK